MKPSTRCIVYQALQLEVRYPGLLRTALGIHHKPFSDTGLGSVQRVPDSRDQAAGQRVEKVTKPTAPHPPPTPAAMGETGARVEDECGQRSELML